MTSVPRCALTSAVMSATWRVTIRLHFASPVAAASAVLSTMSVNITEAIPVWPRLISSVPAAATSCSRCGDVYPIAFMLGLGFELWICTMRHTASSSEKTNVLRKLTRMSAFGV
ncbi:MAG: hypothetical protein AAF727_14815 [Pseudomonadota bacterium]